MMSENRASLRLAAILAIVFLGACAETKTGGTGTGVVPSESE
jgi:hypothetical protein